LNVRTPKNSRPDLQAERTIGDMANMEHALRTLSDRIAAARTDGTALCIRGGGSKDFLGSSPGELLDTRGLDGILSYEPTELVVTVGCGTPLAELEALLAEQGQCLPFEPPHLRWSQGAGASAATVGGMLAAGLAGPARASVGGVRDYVLGLKLINGLGQHLTFGGQVMKNVAGYDVSRLMVGARGTLGLLTEVSLKVLPLAPAEATLCFALEQAQALEQLHRWAGQPLPLNASCWVCDASNAAAPKPSLYVRLRGAVAAVEAACQKMLAEAPGERLDQELVAPDWDMCRDQQLPFFRARPAPDALLWRLSLPQTAPVLALPAQPLIEWHGALRWLWAPASAAAHIQSVAQSAGGSAELFVDLDADHRVQSRCRPMRAPSAALQAISQRLKASFDPQGIFNPGLTAHANQSRA
jgi:glycolate oxidase FAD binding subunit